MIDIFKEIWRILNQPNNDSVVISLLFAGIALVFTNISNYISFRGRLKDKDKRIEDLVEQRNKFQEFVLNSKGLERKSSKDEKGG